MIRRASDADLDRISVTAMRAFANDPLVRWMVPDDTAYFAGLGAVLQRVLFVMWLAIGEVWTTEDGVSVSAWGPPDARMLPLVAVREIMRLRADLPEDMTARIEELRRSLLAHRPSEPHWYLNVLATHPDWHRQGLGSLAMSDVRARCDRDGVGQYLETATHDDVAYYRGRGFEVTETWEVGDQVAVTGMWRNPGAGSVVAK